MVAKEKLREEQVTLSIIKKESRRSGEPRKK